MGVHIPKEREKFLEDKTDDHSNYEVKHLTSKGPFIAYNVQKNQVIYKRENQVWKFK